MAKDKGLTALELSGKTTHAPQPNGTVCNAQPVPTDAAAYQFDEDKGPTCPACLAWWTAVQRRTTALFPGPMAEAKRLRAEAKKKADAPDEGEGKGGYGT